MNHRQTSPSPISTSPNLPSKHRAWMNTKKFKRNDETFEVIEGAQGFENDEAVNVVIFKSLANDKEYEMEESKFFEKITEFEIMSTQANRNNN